MNQLLSTIIGRSRIIMSTLIFMLVAGAIAYNRIPKEA